jgi:diaminohydroxyphosphoribosylaminopyrimidine deaminase / 5-amino-6-(5-phosphoribosylamino)uracil reductase
VDDERWMMRAVAAARAGVGSTYPNPCVGAVLVRRGAVVGVGRSAATGGPHAEVVALRRAGARARGATMYVTLEPCSHVGRTGPCTEAIVAAGVSRVVVGVVDPAPHANRKGLKRLRRRGIEVDLGVSADACRDLHEHYLHHIESGTPFVTLKVASSLDGRVATASGDSRWITCAASRNLVHRLRAEHHAVAVGVETVLLDDPALTVRTVRGTDPVPVVFDTGLRLGGVRSSGIAVLRPGTVVLHGARAPARAVDRLARLGVETVQVRTQGDGRLDVRDALHELGRRSIRSVLVEGGGRLLGSFVAASAWQRFYWFSAPSFLGDDGRPALAGVSWPSISEAPALQVERRRTVGTDLLTILRP